MSTVNILNLLNLSWFSVDMSGDYNQKRMSHSTNIVGSKLFIFGGINSYGFLAGRISYFELNK